MRRGRHFTFLDDLPIDPWPSPSLAERVSVRFVLTLLLIVPFCAVGAVLLVLTAVGIHVYRSYDLGIALRAVIDRRTPVGGAALPGR